MDKNNFEKEECLISATETVDSDVLQNIIYKGTGLPQDKRFFDIEDGGVFRYFTPRDTILNAEDKFYSLVKIDDKIVGLSELEKNPNQENIFWIKFISIDPEYQGQGYASKLSEEIFRFAKKNGLTLEASIYNSEGYKKIKPILNRFASEFSVNFIDKEK